MNRLLRGLLTLGLAAGAFVAIPVTQASADPHPGMYRQGVPHCHYYYSGGMRYCHMVVHN